MPAAGDVEASLREIATALHRRAARSRPSFFEPRDWLRRAIEQSLDDPRLRTALFRFVDVLPSLDSSREIGRHLEEYFAESDHALGGLVVLAQTLHAGWLVAPIVRRNVVSLARRFIAEESGPALAGVLRELRTLPAAFTLDVVGEATVSESEAHAMAERYERLLEEATAVASGFTPVPRIDEGARGAIPRVNLSVKLSSLYARFDPLDPESERIATLRLRRVLRRAKDLGAAVTVDMEHTQLKDLTIAIFRSALDDEALLDGPSVAIAIQAYLPETDADLMRLVEWARARRRRIGVRLVKGAYWDSEIAWSLQKGWVPRVYLEKAASDAAFERQSRYLLENGDVVEAAFGSHNLRSLAHAIAVARSLRLAPGSYEIQMLYGMAEPLRDALIESGERVRVYVPVGDLVPGMAYLIRRLLENTSNVSFLRQVYAEDVDLGRLLAAPISPVDPRSGEKASSTERASEGHNAASEFRNEPLIDFSMEANREFLAGALEAVRSAFPTSPPADDGTVLVSRNPARPEEIVGAVRRATPDDVDRAVVAARAAFPGWRETPATERAAVLRRAAEEMRGRRAELAAWIVLEVGKGWRDADAEVAEAIDYLEYYAREMLRLAPARETESLPGETNELVYEALGVAAVVSPWNFPLAIAMGMTAAALVAGNVVLLKPAEQSPILGALVGDLLVRAGAPPAALAVLHGGGEIGAALVRHADVRIVAFTGSRAVGLEILGAAAASPTRQRELRRAVCEMGGKNAIIVDEDADRDEAILAVLESAFGYQGQKCSAASRVVVVGDGFEAFVGRLAEAARTLRVGPPEDPRNAIGPLIDDEAFRRVTAAVARARSEGKIAFEKSVFEREDESAVLGWFVGPVIVTGLEPDHPLAQEEIFGPLLVALPAATFEEALEIANATEYGLTGGVFSRSPANLGLARRAFRVGNLYLNRGITGAVVGRQPFGGLKLSGAGWKAGGPDYLLQFLESRAISENTLRHGFAPEGA